MSDARWCNYGDHAFDGSRTDTVLIGKMQQVQNQWGGQQPSITPNIKEICGDCAALIGIDGDYTPPEKPDARHAKILGEVEKDK